MTQAISIIRTDDNNKLHFIDAWHLTLGIINAAAGKGDELFKPKNPELLALPKPDEFEKLKNFWKEREKHGRDASNSKNSSVPETDKRRETENNPVRRGKKHPSILKPDDVTNTTRSDTNGMIYTPNETSVNSEENNCSACRKLERKTCSLPPASFVVLFPLTEVRETKMESNSNSKPSVHSDSLLGGKKHPSILKPVDVTNTTRSDTNGMIDTQNETSVNSGEKKCPACVNGGLETCPTPVTLMRGQLMEVKETKMGDNSNSNLPATSDIEYGANEDESNDESESSDCCTTLSNADEDHCDDSTTIIHSENGSQETTSVQEMTSNSNKEGNDDKEAATIEFKEPSNRSIKPSIKGQDKKMRKDKMSKDTMNALKRYLIERTLKFVKETCRTAVKKSW